MLKSFLYRASALWMCVYSTLAMSENTPEAIAELRDHAIKSIYQPYHSQYLDSTSDFLSAVRRTCDAPEAPPLEELYSKFNNLVAAFSTIELYRVGPLMEENRHNRIFYWPDKRRIGERQLRDLVASTAATEMTRQRISKMSVALQGIPVIEQLLYVDNAKARLRPDSNTPDCQILSAVAENLLQMAEFLDQGWHDDALFVQSLRMPETESEFFRSDTEVLQSFVTQVIVGVDILLNRKIAPLLVDRPSIRKAPLWRSHLTMPMIAGNLAGIQALTISTGLADMAELKDELTIEFRTAGQILQQLIDLPQLADNRGQLSTEAQLLIQLLETELRKIDYTLRDQMTSALGVGTRFNSRDGD